MFNIKEVIDDLIEEGYEREEAVKEARERFRKYKVGRVESFREETKVFDENPNRFFYKHRSAKTNNNYVVK